MQLEVPVASGRIMTPKVLCCMCGCVMESNPTNMCVNCIRSHVDITSELPRESTISYCKLCQRYQQPPNQWVKVEMESRELMNMCLKRIKGLNKVRLIDASWLWTEPHSKRLKMKLTVQKELFEGALIQQSYVLEYVVHWQQCEACQRAATGQPQWDAVVQVRQKVGHRRTFLYLEQLILQHNMHTDATKIEVQPDGLDFFFGHKSHGQKFLDFISSLVPVYRKDSHQLVTADLKSNTAEIHYAFSAEIAPICREDLVCLPRKISIANGGIGPIVLCHKIHSSLVFLDPLSLRVCEIAGTLYWKMPFPSVASAKQLVEFYVVDVRLVPGMCNGKFQLADVTVALASEVGHGREWITRSHLGQWLHPGDSALGYLLPAMNVNHEEFTHACTNSRSLPDVILVRKYFANQRRKRRQRQWELKQLPKDGTLDEGATSTGNKGKHQGGAGQDDNDMDEFMDELERDPEYRKGVRLYAKRDVKQGAPSEADTEIDGEEEEEEEDDCPQVAPDELLSENENELY